MRAPRALWLVAWLSLALAPGATAAPARRPPVRSTWRRPAPRERAHRADPWLRRETRRPGRDLLSGRDLRRVRGARDRAQGRIRIRGRLLSPGGSRRFLRRVLSHERRFYQPGVSYDATTGLTFDGHAVDIHTGRLRGGPRNLSAASKESLHIILLTRAVEGDPVAQALITPDPAHPHRAVARALDVLGRKIDSYRAFDREHPGFGGFLPWFHVVGGAMEPMPGWANRAPGLDNGQLAWSLYLAERALRQHGDTDLADRYRAQLQLMKDNVVRVFYDPTARQLRSEARFGRGDSVAPADNRYLDNQPDHLLDDGYEGLMLVHFADLFGDWSQAPAGAREALWRTPRQKPARFGAAGREVTAVEGNWFSAHEQWGFLVLPYRDVPVADRLFVNGLRVATQHAARRGYSGLFASTHRPVSHNALELDYESANGIAEVAREKVRDGEPIFAPYAAFPLALVDHRLFASWLESMVDRPGMFGPFGIGESYSEDGKSAPVLTWDGKALAMVALMGGVSGEIRRDLTQDGLYQHFLGRVAADYRLFDGVHIEGDRVPLAAPPPRARPGRGASEPR